MQCMHAEYDDVTQARIKKIMQGDDDVGKVAAAVPVIICILAASSVCVCVCVRACVCARAHLSACLFVSSVHLLYRTDALLPVRM